MSVHSAGILVYRFEESDNPLEAAKREFREETGFALQGEFIELGELRQPSKKIIHAWCIEDNFPLSQLKSNTFRLEWPRKSGNIQEYPEVDRGEWFSLNIAQPKIFKGQRKFLKRLVKRVPTSSGRDTQMQPT